MEPKQDSSRHREKRPKNAPSSLPRRHVGHYYAERAMVDESDKDERGSRGAQTSTYRGPAVGNGTQTVEAGASAYDDGEAEQAGCCVRTLYIAILLEPHQPAGGGCMAGPASTTASMATFIRDGRGRRDGLIRKRRREKPHLRCIRSRRIHSVAHFLV
jgi:hypothetical protein